MNLTERQKKHLRRLSHDAKPVVTVASRGLSDNVLAELEGALTYHELVKVRIRAGERQERDTLLGDIVARCHCVLVKRVGHVATFYRHNKDKPKIILPGAGK